MQSIMHNGNTLIKPILRYKLFSVNKLKGGLVGKLNVNGQMYNLDSFLILMC